MLGPRWHVAHFSDRADGVEGISIAARRPLAAVHEVDLNLTPRTAGFPCGTLVAEVDMPAPAGLRFWTGRQSLAGTSVCYRDAWERAHPGEPGPTFSPEENPLVGDPDWPFRRIDHILVRCGEHGGPTLGIERCERIFDRPDGGVWASDHFGVTADLAPAASGGTRPR